VERRGYIYVLATAYWDGGGQRIMKIGRTGRTPDKRVRELSRGGPTGMVLVGAVSCRNMIELEKRAHLQFQHVRFPSGGGTEYFTADPDGLLKWLREETPRFDLESARKDAWAECVESRPFKRQGRITLLCIVLFFVSPIAGLLFQPFHPWTLLAGPVIYIALFVSVGRSLQQLGYMRQLQAELQAVQRELETKYYLPVGGVRS
jgi:hypothetical protein